MLHQPTLRVLMVLELLSTYSEPKTLTEIATETGISKATIFPILKTLQELNYISVDTKLRYSLGLRVSLLTNSMTPSNVVLACIHDVMQNMVDLCNEVCQLGILDGQSILYIDRIQSTQTVQHTSYVGIKLSALETALGKVLLSYKSEEELIRIFGKVTPSFLKNLANVRECNYAIDDRVVNKETKCYAVALCRQETPIAAISISLPFYRDNPEKQALILKSLFEAKHKIEQILSTDLPSDFKLTIN